MRILETDPVEVAGDVDHVIIDGMNLAYRCFHTIPVKFGGKRSGLYFGFINKVLYYRDAYEGAKVSVLWEGEGENSRKSLMPTYKGNRVNSPHRSDVPNDFQENLQDVRDTLPLIGVYQYSYPALEADDLAHYLCEHTNEKVLLITNDMDWYGFLKPDGTVRIEDKFGVITYRKAYKKLGYDPRKVPLYKSIRGCRTDNVEQAIDRIAEQRLADLVEKSDNLNHLIRNLSDTGLQFNVEMVRENHTVVSFFGDIVLDDPSELVTIEPTRDKEQLKERLLKWGCFSLLERVGLGKRPKLQPLDPDHNIEDVEVPGRYYTGYERFN